MTTKPRTIDLWNRNKQVALEKGISYGLFRARIRDGATLDEALVDKRYKYKQYKSICEENNIKWATFVTRVRNGMCPELAATTPNMKRKGENKPVYITDKSVYALYRKGRLARQGTLAELAAQEGIKVSTLKFWLSPTHRKRAEKSSKVTKLVKVDALDEYDY